MKAINLIFKMPPYGWTAIVAAAIAWLTLVPHPLPDEADIDIPGLDKIVHALMFGGLYLAMAFDTLRRDGAPARLGRGSVVCYIIICVAAGALVELAQERMGLGRTGSASDWVADAAGVGTAAWIAPPLVSWLQRMRP